MNRYDYIIVGHGLAGAVLALSLVKENKKVLIIDEPSLSSSSKVAAGLYQPMTFKRTVETWKGLDSIVFSTNFYQWAETFLNENFFFPLPMYRMFSSYEEQNNWSLKSDDNYFSKLIGEENNDEAESCNSKFGYGRVFHSGYLDIPQFLVSSERYFREQDSFLNERINYEDICISENEVTYKNFIADSIFFCEGWMIKDNPWFSYIPMKPVKGEVLTVQIKNKSFNSIISGGLFSVPRTDGFYKVGSNYNWNDLNEIPTQKVKDDFVKEISEILNTNEIFIQKHEAGIRPASHDRRPIFGRNPQYANLFVFNGFGARGVALAPFTAQFIIDYLIHNQPIPPEISCDRFNKYFRKA